jgi:hypothetical protein
VRCLLFQDRLKAERQTIYATALQYTGVCDGVNRAAPAGHGAACSTIAVRVVYLLLRAAVARQDSLNTTL